MARDRQAMTHAIAHGGHDAAFEHKEESGAALAGHVKALAILELHGRAEAADARDLRRRKHGEHLVAPACVHRRGGSRGSDSHDSLLLSFMKRTQGHEYAPSTAPRCVLCLTCGFVAPMHKWLKVSIA